MGLKKIKSIFVFFTVFCVVAAFFSLLTAVSPDTLNAKSVRTDKKDNIYNNSTSSYRLINDNFYFNECQPLALKKQKILPGTQKGFYMTGYSMGMDSKRQQIYDIIEKTELNSVVFNVKDDEGYINYDTENKFAIDCGAKKANYDIKKIIKEMNSKNIYSIARIVVFKDPVIAKKCPEMAIKDIRNQNPLYSEGSYWPDIYCEDYWNYIADIALEVALMGVDEIQLDYIRGPARGNIKYAKYSYNTQGLTKSEAICNFLKKIKSSLEPIDVKISGDVFGFALIENNDQGIGQTIMDIADYVDYLCPMVYPSHYSPGFLGFNSPESHPYEVVEYSLKKGSLKIKNSDCLIIPWLQAFGMSQKYSKKEILAQISASEKIGMRGFLFWNASNNYKIVEEALVERTSLSK